MFPIIFMSIYYVICYIISKYIYRINAIIGMWISCILFAFSILFIKFFLYTYWII